MTQSTNSDSPRPIDQTLHDACSALDEPKVLAALDAGANSNALDDGASPLLATLHGDNFISSRAGLPRFPDDETDHRRIRIFSLLLARGADINQDLGDCELLWYAVHHSAEVLEFLLAHGWPLEDELRDFLFFLLVGLKVPLDLPEAANVLRAAVGNGHETVLRGLVFHHSLGPLFRQAATTLNPNGFLWTFWPDSKRASLLQALSLH